MRGLARLFTILFLLALAAVAAAAYWGYEHFEAAGPLESDTVVYIPPGSGLDRIASTLSREGVIADPLVFRLGTRVLGAARGLKAGEYVFPAAVSMRGIVELLESGETLVRRLTVPEGVTSQEAVTLIEQAEYLNGEIEAVPPEGSLLPETYHYSRGDRREAVLERMRAALTDALAELWPRRVEGLPLSSPREAVILASIVEKETGLAEERPMIASVFYNRLRGGMRLQSDPTVVYGLAGGSGALGRPLTRADLQTPTPFNTYLIDGLPPEPISNPGRAAIEAVLQPAETEYLYFVADGNGGHRFAETLAEHNRNVAEWRRAREGDAQ